MLSGRAWDTGLQYSKKTKPKKKAIGKHAKGQFHKNANKTDIKVRRAKRRHDT